MSDTSARFGIVEPSADRHDAADVPLYVRNVVARLEAIGVLFGQGPIASRPAFGVQGRLYASTDETPNGLYYDLGTAWFKIGSLATGAVGGAQIADGSITLPKLAPGSVDGSKIIDGSITTADIADGSIIATDLDPSLKPSAGAGASTEALRALGTAAGQAAPGTHHTQHEVGGADQITISQSMLDPVTAGLLPQPGDIKWVAYNVVAGSSEPPGWLLCDGRTNLSTTTYAALFAKLNYAHGGSGAQFGIPDLRGRTVIGIGNGGYAGATTRNVGDKGGEETHQLSIAEMPSHNHGNTNGGTTGDDSPDHSHTGYTSTIGDHNHTSPFYATGGIANELVVAGATGDNTSFYTADKWGTAGTIIRGVSGTTSAGGHSHTVQSYGASARHQHSIPSLIIPYQGTSSYHNNMQPYIALTPLIKT